LTSLSSPSADRSYSGRWQRGGNASNNVTVLSLLGEKCELLCTYSTIDMFKFVLQDLTDRGIETKHCVGHDNCQAPLSTVLLSLATGTRTIVHSNPNLPHLVYADFAKCQLDVYKWIHFEARNPDEVGQMMRRIRSYNADKPDQAKIKVSLDLEKPKQDNLRLTLVEYSDYVFLGKDFAQQLGCDDMKSSVYALKERFPGHKFTVVCPWGEQGAAGLDANNQYYSCPAYPPEKVVVS
jgi:ketohexokinase